MTNEQKQGEPIPRDDEDPDEVTESYDDGESDVEGEDKD